DGQLSKWAKEVCLLDQVWVKDAEGKKDIRSLLTDLVAKTGENVRVRRFMRYEVGEGLEKRADDFAAEVKKQAGQAYRAERATGAKGKGKGTNGQRESAGRRPNGVEEAEEPSEPSKPPLAPGVKYRRILLKLSGEALMGPSKFGLDQATLAQIADE